MSRQDSNMRVQIHASKGSARPGTGNTLPGTEDHTTSRITGEPLDDHDISVLKGLFGGLENTAVRKPAAKPLRLVVINGPNINMLGIPTYGLDADDYPALLELCKQTAQETGFARCDCFQSNHEGDLVDIIQDAYGICDAIVINPGAYGTSPALRDALRTVGIPTAEVHLHQLDAHDAVAEACVASVVGRGVSGYQDAIRELAGHLQL